MAQEGMQVCITGNGCRMMMDRRRLMELSMTFRTMLGSGAFRESYADEVVLSISSSFLKVLADLVNRLVVHLDEDNLREIMGQCDKWGLADLMIDIYFYIRSNISHENCLFYLVYTEYYGFYELESEVFKYCCKNFQYIPNSDLKTGYLQRFMSSSLLNISEEQLVKLIGENQSIDLQIRLTFLSHLRLNLLHEDVLNKMVRIGKCIDLKLKVENILKQRRLLKSASDLRLLEECRYKQERAVILALNGGEGCRTMECWVHQDPDWRFTIPSRLIEHPYTRPIALPSQEYPQHLAATAYDDYNVYVIGGSQNGANLNICAHYSVGDNGWKPFPELLEALYGHSAAIHDRRIFVTGGSDSKKIYTIMPKHLFQRWDIEPVSLLAPRYFHCSVAAYGYLYIIGGLERRYDEYLNAESQPVDTMWRYNILDHLWEEMQPMINARAYMSAVLIDAHIYVFGGRNELGDLRYCEKYDIKQNKWYPTSPMDPAKSCIAAVYCEGRVYCSGGQSNGYILRTTDIYNPLTNTWHTGHSLQLPRKSHGMAVVYVPELSYEHVKEVKYVRER